MWKVWSVRKGYEVQEWIAPKLQHQLHISSQTMNQFSNKYRKQSHIALVLLFCFYSLFDWPKNLRDPPNQLYSRKTWRNAGGDRSEVKASWEYTHTSTSSRLIPWLCINWPVNLIRKMSPLSSNMYAIADLQLTGLPVPRQHRRAIPSLWDHFFALKDPLQVLPHFHRMDFVSSCS